MSRKASFYIIRLFLALLLIVVLLEVGLRLIGFDYPQLPQRSFVVEPDKPFFIPHDKYGFAMSPGQFYINQDEQLKWTSTQDKNGYRITSDSVYTNKPEIWIFGCSFTYGWGVNDNETYPWLLQEALPQYTIKNYGVGAYGTLHSNYQLQDELAKGKKPAMVILAYLPFHDQRNTASRFWMRAISTHQKLLGLQYPYARLSGDSLQYSSLPLGYQGVPGSSWSRVSGFIEVMYNKSQHSREKDHMVSRRIILDTKSICDANEVPLLICYLEGTKPEHLKLKAASFAAMGFNTLEMGLDLSTPEYTFLPIDPHPNQVAHRHYANELANYLKTADLQ